MQYSLKILTCRRVRAGSALNSPTFNRKLTNHKTRDLSLHTALFHAFSEIFVRHIITFKNLFQVLKAERILTAEEPTGFSVRPTPTPPGLGSAICGMSLEILDVSQKTEILARLERLNLTVQGIFEISD